MAAGRVSYLLLFGPAATSVTQKEFVMTKAELIQSITQLARFKGVVVAPVLESTNGAGDNIYRSNVRALKESSSIVVQYIDVYFIVIDEGGGDEDAYILDRGESDLHT